MTLTNERRKAFIKLLTGLINAASEDGMDFAQACYEHGVDYTRICSVLPHLVEAAMPAGNGNAFSDWREAILSELGCLDADDEIKAARMERVSDCVMAIPGRKPYEALMKKYSGERPANPRPGWSHIDENDAGYDLSFGKQVDMALEFLREPVRLKYIRTGQSDLVPYFTPDALTFLRNVQVHVCSDLDRFDDEALLNIPGITPRIVSQVYMAKVNAGKYGNPSQRGGTSE